MFFSRIRIRIFPDWIRIFGKIRIQTLIRIRWKKTDPKHWCKYSKLALEVGKWQLVLNTVHLNPIIFFHMSTWGNSSPSSSSSPSTSVFSRAWRMPATLNPRRCATTMCDLYKKYIFYHLEMLGIALLPYNLCSGASSILTSCTTSGNGTNSGKKIVLKK